MTVTVKPLKAPASSWNLAGQVGLYPKERIGVVPDQSWQTVTKAIASAIFLKLCGGGVASLRLCMFICDYCRTYIKAASVRRAAGNFLKVYAGCGPGNVCMFITAGPVGLKT